MTWNGTGTEPGVAVFGELNNLAGGAPALFFLAGLWLVVFFRLRGEPTREGAVAASWVTLMAAVLLRAMDWIPDTYLGVCVFLAIGSLVLLINRE